MPIDDFFPTGLEPPWLGVLVVVVMVVVLLIGIWTLLKGKKITSSGNSD